MTTNIIIEPIQYDDIIKYDKEKFNSNNHWNITTKKDKNNDYCVRPLDYYEKITNSNTKNKS